MGILGCWEGSEDARSFWRFRVQRVSSVNKLRILAWGVGLGQLEMCNGAELQGRVLLSGGDFGFLRFRVV